MSIRISDKLRMFISHNEDTKNCKCYGELNFYTKNTAKLVLESKCGTITKNFMEALEKWDEDIVITNQMTLLKFHDESGTYCIKNKKAKEFKKLIESNNETFVSNIYTEGKYINHP